MKYWPLLCVAGVLVCSAGCEREGPTNQGHRSLLQIDEGTITNRSGGPFLGYGFYSIDGQMQDDERNFLLILQNISSKNIDTGDLTITNMLLRDSSGKAVTIVFCSVPQDVAYGRMTSLHIAAIGSKNLSYPLALTLRTTLGDIPVNLSITNIDK